MVPADENLTALPDDVVSDELRYAYDPGHSLDLADVDAGSPGDHLVDVTATPFEPTPLDGRIGLLAEVDWAYEIQVYSLQGALLERIPVDLVMAESLARIGDDFLVAGTSGDWGGESLYRVGAGGELERFSAQTFSFLWDIHTITTEEEDDTVVVADEYEAVELNDEGEVESSYYDSTHCWMAATDGEPGSAGAMLDVYGDAIFAWDAETNDFIPVMTGVGYSSAIGRDLGGAYYATSGYGDPTVQIAVAGEANSLATLPASGVAALEPASASSVFALTNTGAVYELDRWGDSREIFSASGGNFIDLTAF